MEKIAVPQPMKRPDYVFYHTPTVMEMRMRAIEAIHDFLSIQWKTHKKIAHSKKGAVSHKRFIYEADTIRAGIPYTDAGKGLFQFMEFYNEDTGHLEFYGDGPEFNANIGGTCACGVCWSLATVCHSIGGRFINFWMTPMHGYYPVSGYKCPTDVDEFRLYQTSKIIEENGQDRIVEAYMAVQPADAVCSSDNDHTMMCIDYPVVERDENGNVDLDKSYIMIADQRGGSGKGFYVERQEDDLLYYSGRNSFKYTFRMLLKEFYIPVTPGEFLGTVPYERAKVEYQGNAQTRADLCKGTVTCNYPMAVIKLILTKGNGHKVMIDRYMINRSDVHPSVNLARYFPLAMFADAISNAQGTQLEGQVTASNGEILTPVTVKL